MPVPFTQFLFPRGIRRQMRITLDPKTEAQAAILFIENCELQVEIIEKTGEVWMTVCQGQNIVTGIICENTPAVRDVVKQMIYEAVEKVDRSVM